MKKIVALLIGIISFIVTQAQMNMNCCVPTATEKYALNANDKDFIAAHISPLPYTYVGPGSDINYKTSDGTDAHAYQLHVEHPTESVTVDAEFAHDARSGYADGKHIESVHRVEHYRDANDDELHRRHC